LGKNELALFTRPPVLLSESAEDFNLLRAALVQEVKPRGVVEQMFLSDFAAIAWEIKRLRRCKEALISMAFRAALKDVLVRLLDQHGKLIPYGRADTLARSWFTDQKAKEEVSEILLEFKLNEAAIEAEAIRRSFSDIEVIDSMLSTLEVRRYRALRSIADFRDSSFVSRVREVRELEKHPRELSRGN
jgi:hypothetical protein